MKTETHREKTHVTTVAEMGVLQLQVKEHQGFTGQHQKLGRDKAGFYPKSQRERGPADTLISDCYLPDL